MNQRRLTDHFYVAEIPDPLPRAFTILGVDQTDIDSVQNDMRPTFSGTHFFIGQGAKRYSAESIDEYSDDFVKIEVNVSEQSLLVLTDLWHPFWKVTIDDEEQAMLPAFFAFRGVKLEPGKHVVEFSARVPRWSQALWVSGIALIIFIFVGGMILRAYPRRPAGDHW